MKGADYYHTMEIKRTASGGEIKHAYHRLARRFHPDVSDDPDGETKFKALADAYRTLKQPDLRAAYDGLPSFACTSDDQLIAYSAWDAWVGLFDYPGWMRLWDSWRVDPYPGR